MHTQGTLVDMNHLFMATYYLQRGPITPSGFFPRIDCTTAANSGGGTQIIGNDLTYSDLTRQPYFETNIVGSINVPMGVAYMLAPFLTYHSVGAAIAGGSCVRACTAVCMREAMCRQ